MSSFRYILLKSYNSIFGIFTKLRIFITIVTVKNMFKSNDVGLLVLFIGIKTSIVTQNQLIRLSYFSIRFTETGDCLKILRIEDGNLNEMLEAFLDTVKGYMLPMGTVVTLCSLSQLIKEDPATYAVAFRGVIGKLASKLW